MLAVAAVLFTPLAIKNVLYVFGCMFFLLLINTILFIVCKIKVLKE